MQYLLTEEEMKALVPIEELNAVREALAWCFTQLQPAKCPHREGNLLRISPYCDECPLSQGWKSQDERPSYEISKQVCTLARNYSK